MLKLSALAKIFYRATVFFLKFSKSEHKEESIDL